MKSSAPVCKTLCITALLLYLTAVPAIAELPEFRIGAILPLTGNAAALGQSIRNGMEMALSDLSADRRAGIKVIYEDDSNITRNSVAAYRRLTSSEKVQAVISSTAQPGLAIAPLAESDKVPLVSISLAPAIVAGRHYAFLLYVTPERMAQTIVEEAVRRGYRKVARVTVIAEGAQMLRKYLDEVNRGRFKFVIDEEYPLGETDFRLCLARIRQRKDIDAVFVNLNIGQIGLFARQAREQGINLPLFSNDLLSNPKEVADAQGALKGQWYVNQADGTVDFQKRYQERYPEAPLPRAGNGYDFIMLIDAALKSGVSSAEGLRLFLENVKDFKGAFGTYSSTGDHRFGIPAVVKVVDQ